MNKSIRLYTRGIFFLLFITAFNIVHGDEKNGKIFSITDAQWSADKVIYDKTVTLSAKTEGLVDKTEVICYIYQYDSNGEHDYYTAIPAQVKQNMIKAEWTINPSKNNTIMYPQFFFTVCYKNISLSSNILNIFAWTEIEFTGLDNCSQKQVVLYSPDGQILTSSFDKACFKKFEYLPCVGNFFANLKYVDIPINITSSENEQKELLTYLDRNKIRNLFSVNALLQPITKEWHLTDLHIACFKGELNDVQNLIMKKTDINKSANFNTYRDVRPIDFAALGGHLDVVKYLFIKGGYDTKNNISIENRKKHNLLHYAIEGGDLKVLEYLLEKGLTIKNKTSLIHFTSQKGNLKILKYFINTGFNIKEKTDAGESPMHYAAMGGGLDIIRFLRKKNVSIYDETNSGDTVLHYSAKKGDIATVKYFITEGLEYNKKSKKGLTPFHYALNRDDLEVAKYLVTKIIDINEPDPENKTYLHHSVKSGDLDIVKYLVYKGIDIHIKDKYGKTALDYAKKYNKKIIYDFLTQTEHHKRD